MAIVQASDYAKSVLEKKYGRTSRLSAASDYAKKRVAESNGIVEQPTINLYADQELDAEQMQLAAAKAKPDMTDPEAQAAVLDKAANVTGAVGHGAVGVMSGLTFGLSDPIISKFGDMYAERELQSKIKQRDMAVVGKTKDEEGNPVWTLKNVTKDGVEDYIQIDPRDYLKTYDKNIGQLYGRLTGMGEQTPLQSLAYDISQWSGIYRGFGKAAAGVASKLNTGLRTTRIASGALAATGTQAQKELIDNLSTGEPISGYDIGAAFVLGTGLSAVGEGVDILRGRYVMRQIADKYPQVLTGLSAKDKATLYEAAEAWELSARTDASGWSAVRGKTNLPEISGSVGSADPVAIKAKDMSKFMSKNVKTSDIYTYKAWEKVYGEDVKRIGEVIKKNAVDMGYDPTLEMIAAKDRLLPAFSQLADDAEARTQNRSFVEPPQIEGVRVRGKNVSESSSEPLTAGGEISKHPGEIYGTPNRKFVKLEKTGGSTVERPVSLTQPYSVLKKPVADLSNKELAERISKSSPFHDLYTLESAIRKLERGEITEKVFTDYTKDLKLPPKNDPTKLLMEKIDRVIVTPERRDVIRDVSKMAEEQVDPTAYERPHKPFRAMGITELLTPKWMVGRLEGWEDIVKDVEFGQLQANVDVQKMNRLAASAMQDFNKRASTGDKVWAAIKNRPTKALDALYLHLNAYENAPDWYPEDLKTAHTQLRQYMKTALERANVGRVARGEEPITDIGAYVPHYIDTLAWEVQNGSYPIKSGYIYSLMKGLSKDIANPSAKHRELVDELSAHFSRNLPDLLNTMFRHHYEDAYVTTPYVDAYKKIQNTPMPEAVRNDAIKYLRYDIRHMATDVDKMADATLDTLHITDAINLVLSPFGRKVASASGALSSVFRTLAYSGGMGLKPYLGVRNSLQTLLAFDLYSAPDIAAAFRDKALVTQDKVVDPETGKTVNLLDIVSKQPWYKQSVDSATENDLSSKLVNAATKSSGMEFTHKQVLDMAVRVGYKDWRRYYELSQDKESKHYKRAQEIAVKEIREEAVERASSATIGKEKRELTKSERKTFVDEYVKRNMQSKLDELLVTKADMLPMIRDAIRLIEWEYFSTSMPWIHRGNVAKSALVYTSWMQNYFFSHQREMWTRVVTGRDTRGKLMTPAQRLRPVKGLGTLYAIARAGAAVLGTQLVGESIMPSPSAEIRLPPVIELLTGAGYYYFSDNEEDQAKGKRMMKHSKELLVPFAGGARFLHELAIGQRQPSELLLGPNKKEQ